MSTATLPPEIHDDVRTLWEYHDMHHPVRPCDLGIGLGSHDLGSPPRRELYHQGAYPLIVFTGARPHRRGPPPPAKPCTTRARPALGVPDEAILVEPYANNTEQNISRSRKSWPSRAST